jgi:hypothetical protein
MSYCSPNIDITDHYTCFEYDELIHIAEAFNKYIKSKRCPRLQYSNKDIKCEMKEISFSKSKKKLWYSIYNRLKNICSYEYCWLDLDFINEIDDKNLREKIKYFTFKPKMTKTKRDWLNTQDINNVLQQYQELFPTFKFIGALPSDFYKVTTVDYNQVLKYDKIGLVFNLDEHNQPGSHWVAFLVDNKMGTLEYYDSVGKLPNKNIQTFINEMSEYLKKNGYNYNKLYNTKKHQYENTECGVYSIYFLIQRLFGFDFEYVTKKVVKDKQMNRFRNVIFRPRRNKKKT